jgi:hypothetical protein
MTEEERELMKRYGITAEQKMVYTFKGYRYDQLKNAVKYAESEARRRATASEALQ